MQRVCVVILHACLALLACGADDGETTGVADDTSGGVTGAATTSGADSTAESSGAATGSVTTDVPSDTTGGETTVAGETTGGQGGACDPAPDDTPCDTCVKSTCCPQLTACADDPDCVCFQECAGSMPPSLEIPMVCGDLCSIDTPFAHPTVGMVLSCSAGCSDDCL